MTTTIICPNCSANLDLRLKVKKKTDHDGRPDMSMDNQNNVHVMNLARSIGSGWFSRKDAHEGCPVKKADPAIDHFFKRGFLERNPPGPGRVPRGTVAVYRLTPSGHALAKEHGL